MECEKCGREMDMYYKLWCPVCDKPIIRHEPILNLIKCLRYLEAIGHVGIKDRVWNSIPDEIMNDSYYTLGFENSKVDSKDLQLIKETWNIQKDEILMEISW